VNSHGSVKTWDANIVFHIMRESVVGRLGLTVMDGVELLAEMYHANALMMRRT